MEVSRLKRSLYLPIVAPNNFIACIFFTRLVIVDSKYRTTNIFLKIQGNEL